MATRVSYEKAIAKVRALGNVLHRPLRDVLDSGARVTATQMAHDAQPFGVGRDAQIRGQKAVTKDIYKVYTTISKASEDISSPRYRSAFWAKYKAGDIAGAQEIINKYGSHLRGVPIGEFSGGFAHIAARNTTTGRVNLTRPLLIVTNWKALEKYVEEERSHVGTGKGGFADIVRAIGGTIRSGTREEGEITASWITTKRKGGGYGSAVHGGTDENPTIRITNRIPYADQILSGSALSEAKRIGRERMILNLQDAVKAETAKLR